jgi:hypothetical protein
MFRRRPGKSDADDASAYSRRAAVTDSAWVAQDRVRSGIGGAFERVSFGFQRHLIWPLQDRAATMGTPGRALSGAAAVVLAAGAVATGLLVAGSNGSSDSTAPQVAVNASAPTPVKAPPPQPAEPTLQGAAPVFEPTEPAPPSEVDPAKAIVKSAPAEDTASSEGAQAPAAAASSSSTKGAAVDGPPAGPAAIAVARDFAAAFLLYETGETDSEVRKAFAGTATPALSRALLERPPRLPANVDVPKAKVVNVIPAPSHGDVYPVSVSLLRVGLTSELRLDLEQQKGEGWRVTNVLG